MDAAAVNSGKPVAMDLLIAHCYALGSDDRPRPTAAARLEALLGRDLARRLVSALATER